MTAWKVHYFARRRLTEFLVITGRNSATWKHHADEPTHRKAVWMA